MTPRRSGVIPFPPGTEKGMLIWLLIFFAVVVFGLGHATRAWLRSNRETRNTDASATMIESGLLTDEERQKMRERLKEKLRR